MIRLAAALLAGLLLSTQAWAEECFARSNFCVAEAGKICHLQIWNPPAPTLDPSHPQYGYKRVVTVKLIEISRSSGYTIIKHGADVGPLYGNPFAGDGDENRGFALVDAMPSTTPPLEPSSWWKSTARMHYGNYASPRIGGQYSLQDGAGMSWKYAIPTEMGPNSGLIARNTNANQGMNWTIHYCERWAPVS